MLVTVLVSERKLCKTGSQQDIIYKKPIRKFSQVLSRIWLNKMRESQEGV